MSGKFEKKDGFIFYPKKVNKVETEAFGAFFDQQIDHDLEVERREKEEKRLLYRMCIIKVVSFPLQLLLIRILMGKKYAEDALFCVKIYWQHLRKKIDTKELKKQLTDSLKQAKFRL